MEGKLRKQLDSFEKIIKSFSRKKYKKYIRITKTVESELIRNRSFDDFEF